MTPPPDARPGPEGASPYGEGPLHDLIPGGAHTYAKGDDQYPLNAPRMIERGRGCRIWSDDGREFIEYGPGLRSVVLGHAFPAVVEAAHEAMRAGTNFNRPSPMELKCAEALRRVVPCAEMVKFAKNGSDQTTAAVRLARAYTGRDLVAVCGDQPFLSQDDWFIGTTPMSAGIPRAIRRLTVSFQYNDLESVRGVFDEHPDQVACLILEPATVVEPDAGYLEGLKALCREHGALLIFDEMITGFRWSLGGAQEVYGVTPDLATFGKGLGNGFSVSALAGRRDIMELGGLRHGGERVFLLSSTHGGETHGLAAALATIQTMEREPVIESLYARGRRLAEGVSEIVRRHDVADHFGLRGRPCNMIFLTLDPDGRRSQAFRTLFLQEMIRNGVIAPSFVVSYAHSEADIDRTLSAVDDSLAVYRKALEEGVERYLEGRPVKPVFRTYN